MLEHRPTLDPPGAGLPPLERWTLRYLAMPWLGLTRSWAGASRLFEDEARRVLEVARGLDHDRLREPVLVRRPPGIEDSSRFWSVAMVMAHLVIVGDAIADTIDALRRGDDPGAVADIAAFKPPADTGPDPAGAFERFAARYSKRAAAGAPNGRAEARRRHPHPWFGPLTAHQWHCLAGAHQRLHRWQVERIVRELY